MTSWRRLSGGLLVQDDKLLAIKSLILGNSVIIAHLESMASEESSLKPVDKVKSKGY